MNIDNQKQNALGKIDFIKKHKVYSTISILAIILSVYFGSIDFTNISIILILSIFIGIITVLWFAISFNKPFEKKIGAVFTLLTCVIIFLSTIINYNLQVYLLERRMIPLIEAMHEYKKMNNKYPEKTINLVPKFLSEIPPCKGFPKKPSYHQKDDKFNLTCVTFGFLKHTYDSKSEQWISWD
jgi:hypothetical protein